MPQNGRLTSKQLAPTFHTTLKLFLASAEAAAAWIADADLSRQTALL